MTTRDTAADPATNGGGPVAKAETREIGATGLKRSRGRIDEEFLTDLQAANLPEPSADERDDRDLEPEPEPQPQFAEPTEEMT